MRRKLRRPWPRHTTCGGFTLVEVLVALMIMAILAVMAWQGVDGIVRARDASNIRLTQTLRLNTVMAQWEQDLTSVQTSVVPSLSFDGASLRLVRRVDGGLQVVVWSLRPRASLPDLLAGDTTEGNVWLRWAGPVTTTKSGLQESWLRSQQFQGNEAGQLQLMSGIAQWQIYFYRGNAWTNAQSSSGSAPGKGFVQTQVVLPTGVRLLLEMAPGAARQGSLTRDVALGPQAS
jgi:general secretion pathway protein J